jgi:hypothetical protein
VVTNPDGLPVWRYRLEGVIEITGFDAIDGILLRSIMRENILNPRSYYQLGHRDTGTSARDSELQIATCNEVAELFDENGVQRTGMVF